MWRWMVEWTPRHEDFLASLWSTWSSVWLLPRRPWFHVSQIWPKKAMQWATSESTSTFNLRKTCILFYIYQHLPKGAVWTPRDGVWAPLIIHSAPLGRSRYIHMCVKHVCRYIVDLITVQGEWSLGFRLEGVLPSCPVVLVGIWNQVMVNCWFGVVVWIPRIPVW